MKVDLAKYVRLAVAGTLTVIFAASSFAKSHVVSPLDLQKEVAMATQARQQNLEKVQKLFSTPAGQQALQSLHANPEQVKTAISTLNDQELAQLAAKADKTQADFAAGTLSDRDLIIILVAIAALILIIVAVR